MCGIRLERLAAPYAEPCTSAHSAHRTTDTADNLLCLGPNPHVLLDHSRVVIDEDVSLIGMEGQLKPYPKHTLNEDHLRYRREHCRTEQ